jgi:hypothetical protein
MTKSKSVIEASSNSLAANLVDELEEELLGPPPLMPGEDQTEYKSLAERVSATVRPRDTLEMIWVRDVIDLTWEVRRFRRLKANLVAAVSHLGVKEFLTARLGGDQTSKMSERWALGYPDAKEMVAAMLENARLDKHALTALTIDKKLESVERLSLLIASAEARRNNAIREIDRHRAALGAAVRAAVEEVEEGEFTDVETGQAAGAVQ